MYLYVYILGPFNSLSGDVIFSHTQSLSQFYLTYSRSVSCFNSYKIEEDTRVPMSIYTRATKRQVPTPQNL